jgi:hypothetical protein
MGVITQRTIRAVARVLPTRRVRPRSDSPIDLGNPCQQDEGAVRKGVGQFHGGRKEMQGTREKHEGDGHDTVRLRGRNAGQRGMQADSLASRWSWACEFGGEPLLRTHLRGELVPVPRGVVSLHPVRDRDLTFALTARSNSSAIRSGGSAPRSETGWASRHGGGLPRSSQEGHAPEFDLARAPRKIRHRGCNRSRPPVDRTWTPGSSLSWKRSVPLR